ncbi:MAG: leucine-rich repeat protein, partial [Oscillospiraceae bacterium]|nr:leucine-rich repeat protein [Oscillospiraceae bacterium]
MKKRLGSILLALAIALSLVPAFAPEARAETEMPGGEFGEGLRWEISNGTLGVYGDGAMPDYRGSDQPWYAYRTSITSLIVGNGITKIGNFAFAGLWSLEEATFYDSLTYIGQFAFSGCGKLAVAELPDSLTDLCSRAFINCSALEEITIPGGVKTIGQSAFSGCTSLVRATLRSGVSTVGINAFSNCSALARVRIPLSVTAVLDDAFGGCGALEAAIYAGTKDDWSKKVTVGTGNDSLTGALRCTWSGACGRDLTWTFCNGTLTISGKGAMPDYDEHRAPWHDYINGWLDIKDVIVEEGVTYIGAKAFYGYGIDTLDIPVSVASIGKKVLYTPWIDVYYHGSEEQRKSIDGVNMIDNDYLWLSIWHDGCGRGTCGEELEWTFRDGVLAVNGWGWMDDYGSS